jgi:ribose 5-phosphate isomerase B
MRFLVVSDERLDVHDSLVEYLRSKNHEVLLGGALESGREEAWARVALEAAQAVARGDVDEGVFCCWTGTGISIAANKVRGIRAALCADRQTSEGARRWNHANVLCLSNRLLSEALMREIVDGWLDTPPTDPEGNAGVATIAAWEQVD